MMEINSLSKLLLSLYVIQKVTSIEVDREYVNCTPFKGSENRNTPTIDNELLDQVANRSLSTIDMNNLISNDQLANMAHIYAEYCNGRTETADFKNDETINWIIFISIISVILFMRNGSSIGFICFLLFFYIRLPLIVAHHSEFDHDHSVDEFIGEGDTIETIFGKHLHYKYTSDGRMMINDCEVIGKLGHGLAGDYKRWSDMDLPRRRLNPYNPSGSWPNGDVCYEIDTASFVMDSWDSTLWNQVVNEYSTKTGINLMAKGTLGACETPTNWIRIYEGTGCWSYIGQVSNLYTAIWVNGAYAGQSVSFGNGCQSLPTMVHELGHAIGMEHTQTRSDRDDWVNIHWDNIQENEIFNFQMSQNPIGFCYDCTSVMHYEEYSFCIDCSQPTITAKDPTQCTIARNPTSPLSVNDVDVIELMYPTGAPTINPVDCPTVTPTAATGNPTSGTPTQPTTNPTLTPTKSPIIIPMCLRMTNFPQIGGVSADLNGDYTYAGDDGNGYPYYTNDDSGTTYYIQYNPAGAWTIHDDPSETLPDGLCFDASLDYCLGTGKWEIKLLSGQYLLDLNSNLAYCQCYCDSTTTNTFHSAQITSEESINDNFDQDVIGSLLLNISEIKQENAEIKDLLQIGTVMLAVLVGIILIQICITVCGANCARSIVGNKLRVNKNKKPYVKVVDKFDGNNDDSERVELSTNQL